MIIVFFIIAHRTPIYVLGIFPCKIRLQTICLSSLSYPLDSVNQSTSRYPVKSDYSRIPHELLFNLTLKRCATLTLSLNIHLMFPVILSHCIYPRGIVLIPIVLFLDIQHSVKRQVENALIYAEFDHSDAKEIINLLNNS